MSDPAPTRIRQLLNANNANDANDANDAEDAGNNDCVRLSVVTKTLRCARAASVRVVRVEPFRMNSQLRARYVT